MRVLLYDAVTDTEPAEVISLDPATDRWGDIWSILVPGIAPGQLYHFQADGPFAPEVGQCFDGKARLVDPYARALAGDFLVADDGTLVPPKSVVVDDTFDWQGDRHLKRPLADTVIYELHVRGFTASPSSGVAHPGTYLGVIEKIPYLKSLGVTAVELMPVHEFPSTAIPPLEGRGNYWGYDPIAFFAPHRGYAAGTEPGCQVREFKEMVRALHAAGIEVILDVVFNHTAEGNELGPTLSFKGLENRVYYMLADGGSRYRNYSGCGNTVNGNHPIVRELIFLCLRHWVHDFHIDGFRFDLASILSRDRNGDILPNPPIVELITEDPLLADTKIIAEAWDAAGAYQVGSFASLRWAEWNGKYRDDVRRYWRGDHAQTGHLATRLAGSSDLYGDDDRQPYHSINFVTSTTASRSATSSPTATSTTRPTAREIATATTTTSPTTTASKGQPPTPGSLRSAAGRCEISSPRSSSRRGCRCSWRGTKSRGRRGGTTTPGAKTRRCRGLIGRSSRPTPISSASSARSSASGSAIRRSVGGRSSAVPVMQEGRCPTSSGSRPTEGRPTGGRSGRA